MILSFFKNMVITDTNFGLEFEKDDELEEEYIPDIEDIEENEDIEETEDKEEENGELEFDSDIPEENEDEGENEDEDEENDEFNEEQNDGIDIAEIYNDGPKKKVGKAIFIKRKNLYHQ